MVAFGERDLAQHVCSLAECGDFDYRDTSLARRCESKRCVRRDRRWNKNWPPPPGRLEKPVQPSNRDRLWIESCEPRERTDLGPDTTCGACHDLCVPEVVRLFCRSGEQEQWECSKSWR